MSDLICSGLSRIGYEPGFCRDDSAPRADERVARSDAQPSGAPASEDPALLRFLLFGGRTDGGVGCRRKPTIEVGERIGSLAWAKSAGGGMLDSGQGVAVLPDGSSIVVGEFSGPAVFGMGEENKTELKLPDSYGHDVFIAKYDPEGGLVWAKCVGGGDRVDHGRGIAALADGSSVIIGEFWGTMVFGRGETNEVSLTSASYGDIFIAKYDPDGTLAWARRAGGSDFDYVNGIAAFADGSSVITGKFQGTVIFGKDETNETPLTATDGNNMFIAKYNSDGSLAWAKNASGVGKGIAALRDGSLVVTGYFREATTRERDIFIAKYSSDGTLEWIKNAGGNGDDYSHDIAALADGSLVITGCFKETALFGKGEDNQIPLTSAGGWDIFVAKYNHDGTFAWAESAGGNGDDYSHDIAALADGSSVITGHFDEAALFGQGEINQTPLASAGGHDVFIARYNPDGNLSSAKRAGGSGLDYGYGIAALRDGSTIVTGYFESTALFGEGGTKEIPLVSNGDQDVFIAKYDSE